MTFNSYTSVSSTNKNNYLYNQGTGDKQFKTERQEELELDMTKYRMYDYALGRFTSIDPLSDAHPQESWTPYQYAYNNPVMYNDPYGVCPMCVTAGIGAGVGFVGGLIAGKSARESLAIGAGGAVAGAFIGSGAALIGALGGAAAIGAANTSMIIGGSSIIGGTMGNLAEQGTKNVIGMQEGFDKNDFTLSMALSVPEALMGGLGDVAGTSVKSSLKSQITKEFTKDLGFKTQNTLAKQLKKDLRSAAKEHGVKLTNKQAKSASQKIINAANQSGAEAMEATIHVSGKTVDVSTVGVSTAIVETTKDKIND